MELKLASEIPNRGAIINMLQPIIFMACFYKGGG